MSRKVWGNITWRLFHTMSLCINEDKDIPNGIECIRTICKHLPCPYCSNEAMTILKKINVASIKTKDDFKRFVHFFHNKVNLKLKAPIIEYESMDQLHTDSLNKILNEFFKVYGNIQHNTNMMMYSFHREIIMSRTRKYFLDNRTLYRFN